MSHDNIFIIGVLYLFMFFVGCTHIIDTRCKGLSSEPPVIATMAASPKLLPWIPLNDGLLSKQHLALESTVSTLRKLEGRDKFTKLLQYGARLLYWWYRSKNPPLSSRAYKLYRTTRLSRKAFRLLKIFEEILKLRDVLAKLDKRHQGAVSLKSTLEGGRCLALGCLWIFDNLLYLDATDTVKFSAARATKGFARAWTVASVLAILLGFHDLKQVGRRRRELAAEYYVVLEPRIARDLPTAGAIAGACTGNGDKQCEEEKVWQRAKDLEDAITGANVDRFKLLVMTLKATMDLTCALNMPGMDVPKRVLGQKLNDGVIGALGCVSAICSLYNVWPTRPQQSS